MEGKRWKDYFPCSNTYRNAHGLGQQQIQASDQVRLSSWSSGALQEQRFCRQRCSIKFALGSTTSDARIRALQGRRPAVWLDPEARALTLLEILENRVAIASTAGAQSLSMCTPIAMSARPLLHARRDGIVCIQYVGNATRAHMRTCSRTTRCSAQIHSSYPQPVAVTQLQLSSCSYPVAVIQLQLTSAQQLSSSIHSCTEYQYCIVEY